MKRMIFGCALMLCGIIGFTGWIGACTNIRGYSRVLSCVEGIDIAIVAIFIIVFFVGLLLSINELRNDS